MSLRCLGDVPTAVVQAVCLNAPFKGQADADLAIAYVAIFILLFYITLFPFRGTLLISRDYTHPPREVEDEEQATKSSWKSSKAFRNLGGLVRRRKGGRAAAEDGTESKVDANEKEAETPAGLRATRSPGAFSDLQ